MRIYRWIFLFLLPLAIIFYGCRERGRVDFIDYSLPAPAQVSDIRVVATPGGVLLTYKIPPDPNFSYAEANCEIRPGVFLQKKASRYADTLELSGFGDTTDYRINIFSVGKNEKRSDVISVDVNPLTPPVQSVSKTLSVDGTFGGVQVGFENESKANLEIVVMVDTTGLNTWGALQTFYTGAKSGKFVIRGLDTIERKFAVFIKDRWGNESDTLFKNVTPLFEQKIPNTTWKALHLDNDAYQPASNFVMENMWDNDISWLHFFASSNSSTLPQWFTVDLGVKVVISRIVEHQAPPSEHFYAGSAVKRFEIWGSNNPDRDGSWENWDSLGTFESFKPSGLPLGQSDDEDSDYGWFHGESFEINTIVPAYRYIRWKSLESYSSSGQILIGELEIYGKIEQ